MRTRETTYRVLVCYEKGRRSVRMRERLRHALYLFRLCDPFVRLVKKNFSELSSSLGHSTQGKRPAWLFRNRLYQGNIKKIRPDAVTRTATGSRTPLPLRGQDSGWRPSSVSCLSDCLGLGMSQPITCRR